MEDHIKINPDDPAFHAYEEQAKAEARDALLGADEYVLVVVKDLKATKYVSVKSSHIERWINVLEKTIKYVKSI